MSHLMQNIDVYITILAVIMLFRSLLIVGYRELNKRFKTFNKKGSFLNWYCNVKKDNPWAYRIWGLSFLWIIVKYWNVILERYIGGI